LKSFNLKEASHIGGNASDSISAECVEASWLKTLGPVFLSRQSNTDEEDDHNELDLYVFIDEDVREAEELFESLGTKEELLKWHSVDDECLTYEHLTNAEIVRNITNTLEASASVPERKEDEGKTPPSPKVYEAMKHIEATLPCLELII